MNHSETKGKSPLKSTRKARHTILQTLLVLTLCIVVGQQTMAVQTMAKGADIAASTPIPRVLTPAAPTPGAPILPGKLPGAAVLVFTHHYTEPGQVRVGERFRLYIEIENQGEVPAVGWIAKYTKCNTTDAADDFVFESACQQRLSDIAPGQKIRVNFEMRFTAWPTSGLSTALFQLTDPSDAVKSQVTVTFNVSDSKPILVVSHRRTHPAQVFANKPFDLHLEIKNEGTKRASGYRMVGSDNCTAGDFLIQSQCNSQLPDIDPGHSVGVTLRLLSPTVQKSVEIKTASINLFNDQPKDEVPISIGIQVFQGITVNPAQHPGGSVQRPFVGAHIEFTRAQAWIVSTDENSTLVVLEVEVRNVGASEARDIAIDFCADQSFRSHAKGCVISNLKSLPPGGMESASIQIVYLGKLEVAKPTQTKPKLSYTFWHIDEWLRVEESDSDIIIVVTEGNRCARVANESVSAACVTTKQLNVRDGPSTDNDPVGSLSYGDIREIKEQTITADTQNPTWWKIKHNNGFAWISDCCVTTNDVSNVPTISTEDGSMGDAPSESAALAPPVINVNPSAPAAALEPAAPVATTRLFVENPRITPAHPAVGEQFTLTFELLNPQPFAIPEVIITTQAGDIIPLGSASQRVGGLLASERRPVSMPLLLQQEPESESVILELLVVVYDEHGQATVLPPERIGFAWVDGHIALGSLAANAFRRPLWQRFVRGFVGLGAGPR